MRLGAGPSGATLVAAYRGTSHPCSQGRTCGLQLSDVYFGATVIAVVLILLANVLARGPHAATPDTVASKARRSSATRRVDEDGREGLR